MKESIFHFLGGQHTVVLLLIIGASLALLGKAADTIIEEAVALSRRLGVSKALIGATVVSLGTTLPEVTVSVLAAVGGNAELALGNSVGSIICDTGLILGLARLLGRVPLEVSIVGKQARLQIMAAVLMVLACVPFSSLGDVFNVGGRLSQVWGFVFLALLVGYLWISAQWAKQNKEAEEQHESDVGKAPGVLIFKLALNLALLLLACEILIPSVEITAVRAGVPNSVIAATLVAFGTSLPELITSVAAVRKGHGELAFGNVVGADILNVLFVAGASAAVTPGGLVAAPHFFKLLFPAMIVLLLVLRVGIWTGKTELPKWTGFALIGGYGVYLAINFLG